MIGYFYLFLTILGTAVGQLLLKKHSLEKNKISIKLIIALILFVSVPFFIYLSLLTINFTLVFLSDAVAIALIVLLSKLFLNERITKYKIIGVLLILIGIILIKEKIL